MGPLKQEGFYLVEAQDMEEDEELDLEEEEEEEYGDEEYRTDLEINILFHDAGAKITTEIKSSNTAQQLMDHIRRSVHSQKIYSLRELLPLESKEESKEGAMFIFQGKDLRELSSHTLKDLGMVGRADIFIVYPGLFLGECDSSMVRSMSSKFLSLVESARTATQTDITVEEFLDKSKESSDRKNIFVEVPLSDGMDLVIPVMINFTDKVDSLKFAIRWEILCATEFDTKVDSLCVEEFDTKVDSLRVEEFDLFLDGIKLDPNSLLSTYAVKEDCNLKLSRKSNAIAVSAPLHMNRPMLSQVVKMELSDSVRKVKARVHQVTGTPPKWQLLRYQNMFLIEESKSLVDLGIHFFFRDYFPWAPENGALQLLPSVRLAAPNAALTKLEVEESIDGFKYRPVAVEPWNLGT